MPELSSYLAERYLTADTKPTKKRKRKHDKSSGGGLLIQDDDDWGSGSSASRKSKHRDDGNEDELPVTVGSVKQVRKTTKANWKTVGGGGGGGEDDAAAAADAILASAAAETEAARKAEEEGDNPTVVATMADGSHAGLQSAASVMAQLERRQREERAAYEAEVAARGGSAPEQQETVYRDATGRRVDTSMLRAEARRAVADAEKREKEKEELLKGSVQIEEAKRRKEALEGARGLEVARRADDVEMNEELKRERRWNDPMARFLEAEDTGGGTATEKSAGTDRKKATGSRRPVYKGPAAPNRYGIRPGYRWDGVDRSNGHEAERFKGINRRERNKGLDYAWQMDE